MTASPWWPYRLSQREVRHLGLRLRRHWLLLVVSGVGIGISTYTAGYLWITLFLAPLLVIDVTSQRLPDVLTLPLLLSALVYAGMTGSQLHVDLVGVIYYGVGLYLIAALGDRVFHRLALGGGDIKLVISFPLLVGFMGASIALCIAAFVHVAWLLLSARLSHQAAPMGPSLIAGLLVVLMGL